MKKYTIEEGIDYSGLERNTFYGRLRLLKIEKRYQNSGSRNIKPKRYFTLEDLVSVKDYTRPVVELKTEDQKKRKWKEVYLRNTDSKSSGSGNPRNRKQGFYMTIQPFELINSFQGTR